MVFQQILNGLANESTYTLLAIGVTMIYKPLSMLNLAHGDTIMISAFICLTLITAGIPIPLAIVLTITAAAFIDYCLKRLIYGKLKFSSFTNLLIATVGVSCIMKNLAIVVWGVGPQVFLVLLSTEPINLGKLLLLPQSIGIICVAACFAVVLRLFFYKTRTDKQTGVAATDPEDASMMGISVNRRRFVTFGTSVVFTTIAGIFLSLIFYISADTDILVGLKAFSATILDGFGNIVGAMSSGIILGVVEALGTTYAIAAYKDIISFVLLFLLLYFKPDGIPGKRIEQKLWGGTAMKQAKKLTSIAVVTATILILPPLPSDACITQIVNMIDTCAIVGSGVNILTGYTGQLPLGQTASYRIGVYITALLNTKLGCPFFVMLPVPVLVTAIFGMVLAVPALKMRGGYLALLTISFGETVRMVLADWIDLTNGPAGAAGIKAPDLFGSKFDTLFRYYYLIVFFMFTGIIHQKWLMKSRTRRAFMAIRDNGKAIEFTGINITTFKIRAFALSAVYSVMAGVLYVVTIHYVSPDSSTNDDSNMSLWIAIMGGMGTTIGPVIGVVIMSILPEALRFLGDQHMVMYGVIPLAVIIRYPDGITSYMEELIGYVQAKLSGKDR